MSRLLSEVKDMFANDYLMRHSCRLMTRLMLCSPGFCVCFNRWCSTGQPHSIFKGWSYLLPLGTFMWFTVWAVLGLTDRLPGGNMLILLLCCFVMLVCSTGSILGLMDWFIEGKLLSFKCDISLACLPTDSLGVFDTQFGKWRVSREQCTCCLAAFLVLNHFKVWACISVWPLSVWRIALVQTSCLTGGKGVVVGWENMCNYIITSNKQQWVYILYALQGVWFH